MLFFKPKNRAAYNFEKSYNKFSLSKRKEIDIVVSIADYFMYQLVKEHDERTIQIITLARNTAMQILLLGGLVASVIAGYFSITVSLTILACIFLSSITSILLAVYYSKKL